MEQMLQRCSAIFIDPVFRNYCGGHFVYLISATISSKINWIEISVGLDAIQNNMYFYSFVASAWLLTESVISPAQEAWRLPERL